MTPSTALKQPSEAPNDSLSLQGLKASTGALPNPEPQRSQGPEHVRAPAGSLPAVLLLSSSPASTLGHE